MTQKSRLLQSILPAMLLRAGLFGLCLYFTGFALHGDRGLDALSGYEAERAALEAELEQVANARQHAATRVAMLREDTLERDMLEEQMRRVLVVAHPADLVVLHRAETIQH